MNLYITLPHRLVLTETVSLEGKFRDEGKTLDIPTRLKAFQSLGRLRGHFIEKRDLNVSSEIAF